MLQTHWRRHGRIYPLVAGALMLGLPMLAMLTPDGGAAGVLGGSEEPDAGGPDPTPRQEATPTPTPTPSGHYELNGIDVTESDDDPDGFFTTSASQGGVSLSANEDLDAGNYGESWLSGGFSKEVTLNYSWSWVTENDKAPEDYELTYSADYTGSAKATNSGASTASASGSYWDSLGGTGSISDTGGSGSSSTTIYSGTQPGADTVSASMSMRVSGGMNLRAHQGKASGNTSQSATGDIQID